MSADAKLTVFDRTLAHLKAEWPEEFRLEVEAHVFRDVGSLQRANEIRWTMEAMKHEATAMGYRVRVTHDQQFHVNRDVWVYEFTRERAPVPESRALPSSAGPEVIDV